MSSLDAQLAALSGQAGKHPGSLHNNNSQERAGRGLHYSKRSGQVVLASEKFPSIIQGKAANQVSVDVLIENAQQAVAELAGADDQVLTQLPSLTSFMWQADLAANTLPEAKKNIPKILSIISCCLALDDLTYKEPCLHILECLLRKCRVHVYYVEDWIWCWLIHLERHPLLVFRALRLVDLTSGSSYLWLRPYMTTNHNNNKDGNKGKKHDKKNNKRNNKIVLPPRALLATHVYKHLDYLRRVCNISTQMGNILKQSTQLKDAANHILSFTAALIIQGWQQQASNSNNTTEEYNLSQTEARVRILVPAVAQAVQRECPNWGYIIASVLGETCDLAVSTIEQLTCAILKRDFSDTEEAANALTTILSIIWPLQPLPADNPSDYLLLIDANTNYSNVSTHPSTLLGCLLTEKAFYRMIKLPNLPTLLGYLHNERGIIIAPLVASLLVMSIARNKVDVCTSILKEDALQEVLWMDKKAQIGVSLTMHLVNVYIDNKSKKKNGISNADIVGLLKLLHQQRSQDCELGFAKTVQIFTSDDTVTAQQLSRLQKLTVELNWSDGSTNDVEMTDSVDTSLLPPRVALEHADESVRLQAIEKLINIVNTDKNTATDSSAHEGQETLVEALLRRWSSDSSISVANKALEAIGNTSLFHSSQVYTSAKHFTNCIRYIINGLDHWLSATNQGEAALDCLTLGIVMSSRFIYATSQLPSLLLGHKVHQQHFLHLILTVMSYAQNKVNVLRSTSVHVLSYCLQGKYLEHRSINYEMTPEIKAKFCESDFVWNTIHHFTSADDIDDDSERLLFNAISVLLRAYTDASVSKECSNKVCDLCKGMIASHQVTRFTTSQIEIFKNAIAKSFRANALSNLDTVDQIAMLSSMNSISNQDFERVCMPIIVELASSASHDKSSSLSPLLLYLDVALRPGVKTNTICKLLDLSRDNLTASEHHEGSLSAIIMYTLSLLEDANGQVRAKACQLLTSCEKMLSKKDDSTRFLAQVCIEVSKLDLSLPGGKQLSQVFSSAFQSMKDNNTGCHKAIELCVAIAMGYNHPMKSESSIDADHCWLPIGTAVGGCKAATVLISSVLYSSQDYKLQDVWDYGLTLLVSHFSKITDPAIVMDATVTEFLDVCISSLKGACASKFQVLVSAGPNTSGTRSRSYSIEKQPESKFDEYSSQMLTTFVDLISSEERPVGLQAIAKLIVERVFLDSTWYDSVYTKLSTDSREEVSKIMLYCFSNDLCDADEQKFTDLRFAVSDLLKLFASTKAGPKPAASTALLAEYARSNAERLTQESDVQSLMSDMLECCHNLHSKSQTDQDDESEYVFLLLAEAFLALLVRHEKGSATFDAKIINTWFSRIKVYVGTTELPYKVRQTFVSCLCSLCLQYPSSVAETLETVLAGFLEKSSSDNSSWTVLYIAQTFSALVSNSGSKKRGITDVCYSIIPSIYELNEYASAKLILQTLINTIYDATLSYHDRGEFLCEFLSSCLSQQSLATCNHNFELCAWVCSDAHPNITLHMLVQCFSHIQGLLAQDKDSDHLLSSKVVLPMNGKYKLVDRHKVNTDRIDTAYFTVTLQELKYILTSDAMSKSLSTCRDDQLELCLNLWQQVLLVNSSFSAYAKNRAKKGDGDQLKLSTEHLDTIQTTLQEKLPVHVFLASISSLMKDGDDTLKYKALRLFADRAELSQSSEAPLYLDLMPNITSMIKNIDPKNAPVLLQSAIYACNVFTRKFVDRAYTPSSKQCEQLVVECMGDLVSLLKRNKIISSGNTKDVMMNIDKFNLQSSILICGASILNALGTRCFKFASLILPHAITFLSTANELAQECANHETLLNVNTSMSVSSLRFINACVEKIPHVMYTSLKPLLSSKGVMIDDLHADRSDELASRRSDLCQSIAQVVPPRLLIPVLADNVTNQKSSRIIFNTLEMCIAAVSRYTSAEAAAQQHMILTIVVNCSDVDEDKQDIRSIQERCSDLVLEYVMKLSELQLRKFYSLLWTWKGNMTDDSSKSWMQRSVTFWVLSAKLCKQLKVIFLPCIGIHFDSIVSELELVARSFVSKQSHRLSSEAKRRKIDPNTDIDTTHSLVFSETCQTYLQTFLVCLENVFRVDAHTGGEWIRSNNNRRYNAISGVLVSLLYCQFPDEATTLGGDSKSAYHHIIYNGEEGCVVNVITSLANAAGTEELWKPLNFDVLKACECEDRSHVRKAGLQTLLQLEKELGEEYMVLLPECLPTLSELLEDQDDEVAGLAKKCIVYAEEILGESLESNL